MIYIKMLEKINVGVNIEGFNAPPHPQKKIALRVLINRAKITNAGIEEKALSRTINLLHCATVLSDFTYLTRVLNAFFTSYHAIQTIKESGSTNGNFNQHIRKRS